MFLTLIRLTSWCFLIFAAIQLVFLIRVFLINYTECISFQLRRSAALGQFYINQREAEEGAIEKISVARKEAADRKRI